MSSNLNCKRGKTVNLNSRIIQSFHEESVKNKLMAHKDSIKRKRCISQPSNFNSQAQASFSTWWKQIVPKIIFTLWRSFTSLEKDLWSCWQTCYSSDSYWTAKSRVRIPQWSEQFQHATASRKMLSFSATRTYGAKFCERRRINLHIQNKSYVIGQKI